MKRTTSKNNRKKRKIDILLPDSHPSHLRSSLASIRYSLLNSLWEGECKANLSKQLGSSHIWIKTKKYFWGQYFNTWTPWTSSPALNTWKDESQVWRCIHTWPGKYQSDFFVKQCKICLWMSMRNNSLFSCSHVHGDRTRKREILSSFSPPFFVR